MINAAMATAPSASRIVWRPTHVVGLAVLCSMLIGCGGDPRPETLGAVYRFVDAPPQEIFEAREIGIESRVLDLRPDPALPNGGWESGDDAETMGWKDGRLHVRMTGDGNAVLTRELTESVAEVDVIEFEIGGLRPSNAVRLMWSDDGRRFEKPRSIRIAARHGEGTTNRTFRFPVGQEPTWSDAVGRIRIVVSGGNKNLFFGRVTGIHLDLDEARLAEACAGSWLFELDGHHRGMVLGLPGESIEGQVRLPPGAEIGFAAGVPPNQPSPVRFRVVLTGEGEDKVPSVVFEEVIGGDPAVGWIDRVVDLSAFAGRTVRIALEVETEADFDPLLGLPMWANPVVWAPTGEKRPPNVVLISIDTLRADRMSLYGHDRPTTPRLAAWARGRAVVFESVVAPSPWTLPSHVSILTGLDALRHGVNHPAPAPTTLLTLAEMLRAQGYATAAVTGGSYLHPRFGLAQGFDDYRSYKGDLKIELETELEHALGWLDDHAEREPFFFFFHTYEVHDPYDPREPYFSEFVGRPLDPAYRDAMTRTVGGDRPDGLRNTNRFVLRDAEGEGETIVKWKDVGVVSDLYDSGIAYTDERLSLLLDRLSKADLRDNTLVIVTSDHGEALGEHRLAGHTSLYDHDLMVPLIIAPPGKSGRRSRVATQVRSIDIAATILDTAGLPPAPEIDGRSLVPLMVGEEHDPRPAESYAALSNHGLALRPDDESKYIFHNIPWAIPSGWEEYYDLAGDPGELDNLAPDAPRIESLRSQARSALTERDSGIRLALANSGDRSCRIEIGGTGISLGLCTVKTTDPGSGCSVIGQGRIGCDLAPGTAITLIGERVLEPRIEVSGTFSAEGGSEPVPFRLDYEVGVDEQPRVVVFDPAQGTMSSEPDGSPTVSISVDWVGNPGILGLDPADSDMELRRQLEALGYIDSADPPNPE